jgi:hypothetical protein
MGFEWKTDDEETQAAVWREEKRSRRVHTPRWRWYLLLLIAAVAAVAYLWRLADQRVEASLEQARADVRVSRDLVERAAATADVELIRTVLSGRDEDWTAVQRDLVEAGNGYTWIGRLLSLAPAGEADEVSLSFDPALRTAELVVAQPYTAPAAGGETAILEQTFVFRRGSNRWLLAPPDAEFWGQQHSLSTALGSFLFPARDRELARDLALDLERDVRAYCTLVGEGCPEDLQVTITFDPDVESLVRFEDGREMMGSGAEITLPAPTLLGRPQNDAGYDALHSAYSRYVLAAVAPRITGWECCQHVLFWQALLQAALYEMGLAPPLLPEGDTLAAVEEVTSAEGFFLDLSRYWQVQRPASVSSPLPLVVRTFVAFLLELPPPAASPGRGSHTLADLEAGLAATPSLGRWWSNFTRFDTQDQNGLQRELAKFVHAKYVPPPLPSNLALPDADLLLVCRTDGARVWRYDLHAESWTAELEMPRDEVFTVLTHGDSYFVSALRYTADGASPVFRLVEKRPGSPAVEVAAESGTIWVPLSKHGDMVPVVFFSLDEERSGEQPQLGMLDLATCRAGQCAWEITPGIVSAAPGGQHELAFFPGGLDAFQLFLRERGADWQVVAEGAFPLWLDSQTFAYLTEESVSGYATVMVQDVEGHSSVLVERDQVSSSLLDGRAVRVIQGAAAAATPDRLFLVAQAGTQIQESYVLAVPRPATGSWIAAEPQMTEIVAKTLGTASPPLLPEAPAGRWLVVTLEGTGFRPVPVYWLVDLLGEHAPVSVNGVEQSWIGPNYDWTGDGAWLAWPVPGGVNLMAPAYRSGGEPYRLFIPAEQGNCGMAAWVERK